MLSSVLNPLTWACCKSPAAMLPKKNATTVPPINISTASSSHVFFHSMPASLTKLWTSDDVKLFAERGFLKQIPRHGCKAHQPAGKGKVAVPAPACPQPGGLVRLERRSLCPGARGKQTHPPQHRLLHLPLVPCDGA